MAADANDHLQRRVVEGKRDGAGLLGIRLDVGLSLNHELVVCGRLELGSLSLIQVDVADLHGSTEAAVVDGGKRACIHDADVGTADDNQLGEVFELDVHVHSVEAEGSQGKGGAGGHGEVPRKGHPELTLLPRVADEGSDGVTTPGHLRETTTRLARELLPRDEESAEHLVNGLTANDELRLLDHHMADVVDPVAEGVTELRAALVHAIVRGGTAPELRSAAVGHVAPPVLGDLECVVLVRTAQIVVVVREVLEEGRLVVAGARIADPIHVRRLGKLVASQNAIIAVFRGGQVLCHNAWNGHVEVVVVDKIAHAVDHNLALSTEVHGGGEGLGDALQGKPRV